MSGWALEVGSPLVDQFYSIYPLSSLDEIVLSHLNWIPEQAVGSPTEYTLQNCRRKKVRMSGERQVNDLMSDHYTVFQIPRDSLSVDGSGAIIPPVACDHIFHFRDGQNEKWNVLSVTEQLMGAVYNCDCERFE